MLSIMVSELQFYIPPVAPLVQKNYRNLYLQLEHLY